MKRRVFLQSGAAMVGLGSLGGCGGGADGAVADAPGVDPAAETSGDSVLAAATSTLTSAALPTWRQGMALAQWKQIPGSALSSAPIEVKTYPSLGATGPASKVVAWCGLALDTRDSCLYSPAGGGHGDYAGNEVHRIRLTDNAPAWVERRKATTVSQVRSNATHYADGRPTSRHSYYGVVCNEKRGRVMTLAGSRWGDGAQNSSVDGFNLATSDWDAARTFPDVPAAVSMYYAAAIVEHKSTGDIYAFANYNVYRWNSATNIWSTVVSGGALWGFEAASALDTLHNRIFVLGGNGKDCGIYTLGTSTTQAVSLTGSAASALKSTGNGMVYVPSLDAYLVRTPDKGGGIYYINAQTGEVISVTTTGGSTIAAAQNGVYRRFLYVPALGGVVYCPAYDANLWFLCTQ